MTSMNRNTPPSRMSRWSTLRRWIEDDTHAGLILLAAAIVALVWANSPARDTYESIANTYVGPESLGLKMSLSHWAADGLLAIFFFMVGVELKQEFVAGSLRDIRQAALPMIAAVLGMVVPALIYVSIQLATTKEMTGWAIPTATDIAFAVALLGIFGRGLPPAARVFLLTLAVVDDLLAITVIAVFYTETIAFGFLAASIAVILLFGLCVQKRWTHPLILIPIALVAWALMYRSGVHATVAGVLLGMTVPALMKRGEDKPMTATMGHSVDLVSSAVALPVFAFFAAGINIVDGDGFASSLTHPVSLSVIAGLVIGKPLGIWGGVWLLTKLTPLRLGAGFRLADLLGVSMLAGIGFTVSLLIARLSFGGGELESPASLAVLVASFISAIGGAIALSAQSRRRNKIGRPDF